MNTPRQALSVTTKEGTRIGNVIKDSPQYANLIAAGGVPSLAGEKASIVKSIEPTTQPTVLSDTNIRDNVIPEIKNDAAKLLTPQQPQTSINGTQPNTQTTTEPVAEQPNEYESLYSSIMGTTPSQDPTYDNELAMLDKMRNTSDARTSSVIDSLSQVYNARRAQQQAVTGRQVRGAQGILAAGGGLRSASGGGVLSGIERQGIRDLSTLDAEEQQLKAQALQAQEDNDYKILGEKLSLIKDKRKEKLDTVSSMWDSIVKQKEQTAKDVNEIVKSAAENGAPADVINKITSATDVGDAISSAGGYLEKGNGAVGEYLYYKRQAEAAGQVPVSFNDYQTIDANRKAKAAAGAGGGGLSTFSGDKSEFNSLPDLASGQMGSVFAQKAMKENLQNAINEGDYKTASQLIVQATTAGLTAENKTKLQNASIDQGVLSDLGDAITAYKNAGGNMNFLKGTADNIAKNLGVAINDPKYTVVATQLERVFQQYRQNMTGAAFGAQESQEYARVLPTKGRNFDLNLSTIEGAENYTKSYIKNNIRTVVGEKGVKLYDVANGETTADKIIKQNADNPLGIQPTDNSSNPLSI